MQQAENRSATFASPETGLTKMNPSRAVGVRLAPQRARLPDSPRGRSR